MDTSESNKRSIYPWYVRPWCLDRTLGKYQLTPVVSKVTLSKGAYIDWAKLPAGAEGIKTALTQQASGMALDPTKVTTLQDNLNSLIPGFVPLLLTLLCMWLLKKNVSPIIIIIALFIIGIGGHVIGLL